MIYENYYLLTVNFISSEWGYEKHGWC